MPTRGHVYVKAWSALPQALSQIHVLCYDEIMSPGSYSGNST